MSSRLSGLKAGECARVIGAEGDTRFLSRVTSIGLTPGSTLRVLKNDSKRPVLVYSRDTMIALLGQPNSGKSTIFSTQRRKMSQEGSSILK